MNWIKEYWKSLKRDRKERHNSAIKERANDIYQITEHCGKLWYTYNGGFFCPCDLIAKSDKQSEVIDVLHTLRSLYIERNLQEKT